MKKNDPALSGIRRYSLAGTGSCYGLYRTNCDRLLARLRPDLVLGALPERILLRPAET